MTEWWFDREVRRGTLTAALLFLAGCAVWAMCVPALASVDEPLHLDYVQTVWHGDLPVFEAGPRIQVEARVPPVQFTAQHPPLF